MEEAAREVRRHLGSFSLKTVWVERACPFFPVLWVPEEHGGDVIWIPEGCKEGDKGKVHEYVKGRGDSSDSMFQLFQHYHGISVTAGIRDGHPAYLDSIRYTKGFCFPGLGGAAANDSIAGVSVAVNRPVCLSFGSLSNKDARSSENVSVNNLSASSRIYQNSHQKSLNE